MKKYGIKSSLDKSLKKNTSFPLDLLPSVRVLDVVLDETHPKFKEVGEWNGIGTIFYQLVQTPVQTNIGVLTAKPLFPNIKNIPLINEIVYIFTLPTPLSQDSPNEALSYYISPINIWNSPHHNATPNALTLDDRPDYNEIESGNIVRTKDESEDINLGETFKEKNNINPLLPFEGDIIYEGRWGNSIRFGSTVKEKNPWSQSGEDGDPITIIRTGQDPNTPKESWQNTIEDINKDLSTIIESSTQQIPLNPASENYNSYKNSPTRVKDYNKSQVIVTSGRLVFNAREDHLLLTSQKSINLNSNDSVNIDTKDHIVNAKTILLGSKDATEPIMLGDKTIKLMGEVLDEVINISTQLSTLTSLPPNTPFIPLNAQGMQSKVKLGILKNKLRSLLSKQNKTL